MSAPQPSAPETFDCRNAFATALESLAEHNDRIVTVVNDSVGSSKLGGFQKRWPDRMVNVGIAEQNMVGTALGFSRRGKVPFVSTFAAFMTRAYDQIRMSQYSGPNIKFCGSHAGVSIGEDGPSQMGLEDIAMFRAILNSVVLYPSDAVSTEKLVEEAARHRGLVYIRTTRGDTPILYRNDEVFHIGGCKILRENGRDRVTVIAAGITLHEALAAYAELRDHGIFIRVIDLYCVKPVDAETVIKAALDTKAIITVEDHFAEGGIGEAILSVLGAVTIPVYSLAVRKMPKSGKPAELLDYEEISKKSIVNKVRELI